MTEIIQFPVKLTAPRAAILAGKSDMMQVIDRIIIETKRHGRSQGFMVGIAVANITQLLLQYVFK